MNRTIAQYRRALAAALEAWARSLRDKADKADPPSPNAGGGVGTPPP
jgi:hypothetical protein